MLTDIHTMINTTNMEIQSFVVSRSYTLFLKQDGRMPSRSLYISDIVHIYILTLFFVFTSAPFSAKYFTMSTCPSPAAI